MTARRGSIRFDDALDLARAWLREHGADLGRRVLLIRDVVGRLAVLTDAKREPRHEALARDLASRLGAYGADPDRIVLFPDDFFDAESMFSSVDARRLYNNRFEDPEDKGPENVFLLEREITGLDWLRSPLRAPSESEEAPRVAFFGLKGGVGRSTALVLLARALARAGSRVLVLDLDLESPGLGALLLPDDRMPRYGIVDYLMEEAIGGAHDEPGGDAGGDAGEGALEALLDDMVARSPLVEDAPGEIRVVPAGGTRGDYLAKLGRVYQPVASRRGVAELAERVDRMIARLAERERADVVLLDSRAGLHDMAAFTVTRLRALALLFAIGTSQTWRGYRTLFEDWRRHPSLDDLRARLRIVGALIPETGRDDYMGRLVGESYDLFADSLYEESDETDEEAEATHRDVFNFDVRDQSAPHYPLPIYWNRALQEIDPVRRPGAVPDDQMLIAAGEFCRQVGELIGRKVEP